MRFKTRRLPKRHTAKCHTVTFEGQMLITTLASLAAAMTFLGAMLFATVSDLRSRRIPNWLVAGLTLVYPVLALPAGLSPMEVVLSFMVAAITLGAGLLCFSKGWLAAGDVKLASVVVLWLGAELALPYLLLSAVFGAMLAFAALVGVRLMARAGRGDTSLREDGVPYGPALAGAGLLIFQISPFAAALS